MDDKSPLYNSRIMKSYCEYLGKYYPDIDIDSILEHAEMTRYEVEDPAHWFTQRQINCFYEIINAKTGNPGIAREVGRYVASAESFGPIKTHIMGFLTPLTAYGIMEKIAGNLTRHMTFKTRKVGRNKIEVMAVPKPGVHEKPHQCENRMGMLESLAKSYTKKYATIEHDKCVHKGGDCCRYIIAWEKTDSLIWKRVRNIFLLFGLFASIPSFFILPHITWVIFITLYIFFVMALSLYSEHIEKIDLTKTIETQGDIARDLIDETNRRYSDALLIQELGQATSTILDIDSLSNTVMDIMEKRLDFDRGIIMLANRDKTHLLFTSGFGYDKKQEDLLQSIEFHLDKPESRGPMVVAFREQKPFLVNDISEIEKTLSERSQNWVKELGVHSLICVPIVYEKESIGVLGIDNAESKRPLTQSDLNLLMGIASQMAVSITNAGSFQKLHESEERYRLLAENAADVIWTMDMNLRFIYISPSVYRLMGYTSEEFLDLTLDKIISPASLKLVYETFKEEMALEASGRAHPDRTRTLEMEQICKDGSVIWVEMKMSGLRDENARWSGIQGVTRDITKRKQAEEALRKERDFTNILVQSSPAFFVAISSEGKTLMMSASMLQALGYTENEVTETDYLSTFVSEADREFLSKTFNKLTKLREPTFNENRLLTRDGRELLVEWHGRPIFKKNGEFDFFFGLGIDITERNRLKDQLHQARKMESIGTLAGGIAHDFNNLLMGIQGNVSLALFDMDSLHPHYQRLKNVEEYIRSGADLTRQLLGFARGGKYEVKPTDLNELIKKGSAMFGRTKKEIKIYRKYQKDVWTVEVDQGQIDQVLLNLYVNAWQAMPAGGELYLQTENITLDETYVKPYDIEPGNYVKISVTDTGAGMDEKTKQKIFDPFFTTKEMGRGTGLGLASAYGIIKNHGGVINVYSEKDTGTTFNICLPASEAVIVDHGTAVGEERPLTGHETILLVDDEDMIIDIGEEILKTLGYNVISARSGEEAIETYRKKGDDIDMVILDMIMPGMNGGETYDNLKEINPEIKVLLSSGYSITGQATGILNRGCNGFIQKPFNIKDLSYRLRTILEERVSHVENCHETDITNRSPDNQPET